MAKESVKARARKRERMVAQYAEKRAALKAEGDYAALDKLPKNASPVFKISAITASWSCFGPALSSRPRHAARAGP